MKRLMILIVLAFPAFACAGIIGERETQIAAATNIVIAETAAPLRTAAAAVTKTPTPRSEVGTCEPPQSVRDPLVPQSALYLTDWQELPETKTLEYQTTRGKTIFEWTGEAVVTAYPNGKSHSDQLDDDKLLAIAPTIENEDGSVTQYGPLFFYRCGDRLMFNAELSSRSATWFPTTPGGGS